VRAFAPAAAALAVVAAGCASAGAGTNGGAASIAPANALVFVAADTDFESSKWHGLGDLLLRRLPASVRKLADGREIDVAVLPGDKNVAFVQGDVDAKHSRRFGDWTAVADDEATLDAVAAAKSHLSDNARYVEAMDALPNDALAHVYATSEEAMKLFASIPGQLESTLIPFGARYRFSSKPTQRSAVNVGVLDYRWLGASLTSSGDGLKLEALAPRGGLVANGPPRLAVQPIQPYMSALADEIPAGVLAVVDFEVPFGTFEMLDPLPKALRELFGSDATLPNDLDTVFGGETALYVRAGLPMPEITLVTQPADTDQASTTLDSLLQRAAPALAKQKLYRAVIGGQFVVSTAQSGIDAFRAGGTKLSSDPSFLEAKKLSGMPDRTTGFAYVDVKHALPLLALAGVKVPKDLSGLRTFTAYGAEVQDRSVLTAFLGVG
jgi:hypothetical protein